MNTSVLVVVLFALCLIYYMWRRIQPSLTHLDDGEMDDFLANRLNETALKHAREHLLRCDECKEKLDEHTRKVQKMKPDRLLKRRF
jgi:hypothetical protein